MSSANFMTSAVREINEQDRQKGDIPGYVTGSVIDNAFAEINKRTIEMGNIRVEIEFLGIVDGYRFVLNGNEYIVKGQAGFDFSDQITLIEMNYGKFKDESSAQYAINSLEKKLTEEN